MPFSSPWSRSPGRTGMSRGLRERPRSGWRRRYGEEVGRRILSLLDQPPPFGYSSWNGRLLAQALGTVSHRQAWRILARHRLSLQRLHSW